jgi:hypothetical protein
LKKNLALAAIALVLLLCAAFQSSNSVPDQLKDIQSGISDLKAQVVSLANKGQRKFYLTKPFTHTGAQTLSACAAGYHMASLWEIHDPTNLRYDTELGFTESDSGFGPPTHGGWIRTGGVANTVGGAGVGNCNAWTSANGADFGTIVFLANDWATPLFGWPVTVVDPWVAQANTCDFPSRVWCVQD